MRLYYKPGACSLASRIVLAELGVPYEAVRVDTASGRTESGADYRAVNPRGYVPALEVDGAVITENPAVLQFLADRDASRGLAPAQGTLERVRLQEWLSFTSSELHKAFSPYFAGRTFDAEEKQRVEATLARRIGDVEHALRDGRAYILGEDFSVADAYLFVVLGWSRGIGLALTRWPHVASYLERVGARSSVRAAQRAEAA